METNLTLTHSPWVNGKYKKFYEKHGYLPKYFDVYNALEVIDIAPTISTRSNGAMGSGTLLIIDEINKNCIELDDYAPTLTSQGDIITKSGTVLIIEEGINDE